jgi:hypothetical protein
LQAGQTNRESDRRGAVSLIHVTSFRQYQQLHPAGAHDLETVEHGISAPRPSVRKSSLAHITSHFDATHGCTYFYNALSRKVAWDMSEVLDTDVITSNGDSSGDSSTGDDNGSSTDSIRIDVGARSSARVQADEYWQLVHANASANTQTSDGESAKEVKHENGDEADGDADALLALAEISRHYCDQHECYYYHNARTSHTAWSLEEAVAAPLDDVEEGETKGAGADSEPAACAATLTPIRRMSRRKSPSRKSEVSVEGEDDDEDAAGGTPLQLHMRRKRAQTGESSKKLQSVKPLQLHLITSLATHRYNSGLATP